MKPGLVLIACLPLVSGCSHQQLSQTASPPAEEVSLYQKNKGLILPAEVSQSLGLELAEVEEKQIARVWTSFGQVYQPHLASNKAQAVIPVSTEEARPLAVGQKVELQVKLDAKPILATIIRLDRQLEKSLNQVEVLIEFADPQNRFPLGAFVTASFDTKLGQPVLAVPETAIIEGAEGEFVYVENGRHLSRTRVKTGVRTEGWVEIVDGLMAGDKVAVKASVELWMIELMAVRGGTPCCPVPGNQKS